MHRRTLAALALVASPLAGCLGQIDGNGPGAGGGDSPSVTAGTDGAPGVQPTVTTGAPGAVPAGAPRCQGPLSRGASVRPGRRFSRTELVNTLTALLGPAIMQNPQIRTQLDVMTADVVRSAITDFADDFTFTRTVAMLEIATVASQLSLADEATKRRIYGACSAATSVTLDCAQAFIANFGAQVYRRPLGGDEAARLLALFKGAPGLEGLARVFMQLLMSPALTFHLELGGAAQGGRVRLTDHEIASRISYGIADTMPDAELMAAAAAGQLQDLATVKAHARRLLGKSPTAAAKVRDFFDYYLQLDSTPAPFPAAVALHKLDPTGLRDELVREAQDFVSHVAWAKGGALVDLFTSRAAFPKSARLATILDAPQVRGTDPAQTTADHAGILLRPAFLSGGDAQTKPMHRAAVIRRHLLCDSLPLPDLDAVANRQEMVGDLSGKSNREALTLLTSPSQCMACHQLINPIGFALEAYDQLGMVRQVETVFNAKGAAARTFAIDTATDDPRLEGGGPARLAGAQDLVAAVAAGDKARACFAGTVLAYVQMRNTDANDACTLREVEQALAAPGGILEAFVGSVASEDVFWKGLER
jgi:hypothetical protein